MVLLPIPTNSCVGMGGENGRPFGSGEEALPRRSESSSNSLPKKE